MISHNSIMSIFVDIIRWNRQLFFSHCLSSLTDTTKGDKNFSFIFDNNLLDKLATIAHSLVIEMIDKALTPPKGISILMYHNLAIYSLIAISKEILYARWLLFVMIKIHRLFVVVSIDDIYCSLITQYFDLNMPDLNMPDSLFVFFKTKLIKKARNVALVSNRNRLLHHFEFVVNGLHETHIMPATLSEHGF